MPAGVESSRLLYGVPPDASAPASIAIPTYERPEMLGEALESALRQTRPLPVLVVDNGTLEETERMVRRFPADRVALYRNDANLGMVGNWNRAILLAPTPWMTILHDDDALCPWICEEELRLAGPSVSLVACRASYDRAALDDDRPAPLPVAPFPPWRFALGNITAFPGVLFDRALALSAGLFRPGGLVSPDLFFWFRLACARPALKIEAVGAFYRRHAGQDTFALGLRFLDLAYFSHSRVMRELCFGSALRRTLAARLVVSSARELYGDDADRYVRGPIRRYSATPAARLPWRALRAWIAIDRAWATVLGRGPRGG